MNPQPGEQDLKRFQEQGDIDSLLRFVQATGRTVDEYEAASNDLKPIWEALSFGWRPTYQDLNLVNLRRREAAVSDIVIWMAGSGKADMKTMAIELMGFLHWKSFVTPLRQHLSSDAVWTRIAAVGALGQFADDWTLEIFRALAGSDPDPGVRRAASELLEAKAR